MKLLQMHLSMDKCYVDICFFDCWSLNNLERIDLFEIFELH